MEDLQVGLWLVVRGFIIHPMFENTLVKQKDREEDVRVNWESTEKKTYDSTLFNYKYF